LDHRLGAKIPTRRWPRFPQLYWLALQGDPELSSRFLRWQLGRALDESDFLVVRRKALDACPPQLLTLHSPARWLLWDFLDDDLKLLHTDFVAYYALDLERVAHALQEALNAALATSTPAIISQLVEHGNDWRRHLLDTTRTFLYGLLHLGYLELDALNDSRFRETFEREWQLLQDFRGLFFDFRVIPKVSWSHFVRYQQLPCGDARIRQVLSCYVTHQTLVYPHLLKLKKLPGREDRGAGLFTDIALVSRLRAMYAPLIHHTVARAARNMGLKAHQDQEREAIRAHTEEAFNGFVRGFDFYWSPQDQARLLGQQGILGLTEDEAMRREVDHLLQQRGVKVRTQSMAVYAFAHYIQQKMRLWVRSHYPADAPPAPTVSLHSDGPAGAAHRGQAEPEEDAPEEPLWPLDAEAYLEEEPDIIGPDGQPYMLIRQAARRYGLSEHQLRRMDEADSFPSLRVGKVLDAMAPTFSLPADTRLYPITPEADRAAEIAKGRGRTRSSQLSGQELNRKQAARHLGIRERQLRHLEETQQVHPGRKGKSLVYDEATLAQVRAALEERRLRRGGASE